MNVVVLTLGVWSLVFNIADTKINCFYEDGMRTYLLCTSMENENVLTKDDLFNKPDVVRLILNRCHISNIDVDAFSIVRFYRILDLSENKIEKLSLGLFEMNTLLSDLNLSHNLLTDLPAGIFNNTQLQRLNLSNNYLKTIKPEVLNIFPRIFEIDLSNNFLVGLDFNSKNLPNVSIINLSGNNMTDVNILTENKDLKSLSMNKCLLKHIPNFLLNPNMQTLLDLDLSTNQITSINEATFDNLNSLQTFNLSNNYLEYIHLRAFSKLTGLQRLDLSYNRLKYIPQNMFKINMNGLRTLDLSHNFLRTIPPRAFDKSALRTLNISNNNITYMYENQILLMSTNLKLKFISFGNNPWQCACLTEFLRQVNQLNIGYDSDSFDGSHPVCVTMDEYSCMRDESVNDIYIKEYNLLANGALLI